MVGCDLVCSEDFATDRQVDHCVMDPLGVRLGLDLRADLLLRGLSVSLLEVHLSEGHVKFPPVPRLRLQTGHRNVGTLNRFL